MPIKNSKSKSHVFPWVMALTLIFAKGYEARAEGVHSSASVMLEVVNKHFTVGKKNSSLYLRVRSDGTAECHTLRYWKEPNVIKSKKLTQQDFEKLGALLSNPLLLTLNRRYERMYRVVDSWMEWKITIRHLRHKQTFEVSGFSPASAKTKGQPYPEVLTKLGCSIWKIRQEVYGDEPRDGEDVTECKTVLGK